MTSTCLTGSTQVFIWPVCNNGELNVTPAADGQKKLPDGHKLGSECKSSGTIVGVGSDATSHVFSIHINIATANNV
jgi:hypothetical protein